jgi:hypothetical protein
MSTFYSGCHTRNREDRSKLTGSESQVTHCEIFGESVVGGVARRYAALWLTNPRKITEPVYKVKATSTRHRPHSLGRSSSLLAEPAGRSTPVARALLPHHAMRRGRGSIRHLTLRIHLFITVLENREWHDI